MSEVVAVFPNTTSWYHNASFLLPLAATAAVALLGALRRSAELLGFAAFLGAVTLAMIPVVLAAWRHTATAVVVTRDRLVSLHDGRVLKSLDWSDVRHIGSRETQGNLRWQIGADGADVVLLDSELEDLPRLLALARELSGTGDRP